MGALQGITVLDFSHYIAGPHCSQILADHGADVIKIEPVTGEASRKNNPVLGDISLYYASMNRSKRGLAVNMKSPEGQEIIKRLVSRADVLVTNYAVGVPERLGIDYETVSAINPRIVMVHISGFGLTGPNRHNSAFDGMIQAMSGIVHLTGDRNGPPMKTGLYIADHISGMQAVIGVLLALNARNTTGKGQLVDVSMLDSMVSMLAYNLTDAKVNGTNLHRTGNRSTNVFATTFQTLDGYLYIAPLTERMWQDLSGVMGHPEWAEPGSPYATMNGRLANYDELDRAMSEWTTKRTTKEIVQMLQKVQVACGPVQSIDEVVEDPQLVERGMIQTMNIPECGDIIMPGIPIKLSDTPSDASFRPPYLGEHNEEVLTQLGFSAEEIDNYKAAKAIYSEKN